MLVSCLTATRGRYSFLVEAVSCFVKQDWPERELIILNNHPVPIVCNLPRVTVLNEPYYETLGDCRNRLLGVARGEFVRTWDDDDLYLPFAISQGVENIGDAPAWKPLYNWGWHVEKDKMYLSGNKYEASWTVRRDVAMKFQYLECSGGNEHNSLERGLRSLGGIIKGDVEPSYIYRLGSGLVRISGSLNKKDLSRETTLARTARWERHNKDHGNCVPIEPVNLNHYWERVERAKNELDKDNPKT
jgi:glycosyltransferase involved in cell wall biosynthesis